MKSRDAFGGKKIGKMEEKMTQNDYEALMRSGERAIIRQNRNSHKQKKLIVLACSTGGPQSLQEVIPLLPADLDAPMVLVQHMPEGFTQSLAERLNDMSEICVKEAEHMEKIESGVVYIAPGGRHMEVKKSMNGVHHISLNDHPPIGGLRPCADKTLESVCGTDYDEITCVVLTGMGSDGTKGIRALNRKKKIYVIAQDEASSIVYGMPKVIKSTGLVNEVVPLKEIANTIIKHVGVKEDGC